MMTLKQFVENITDWFGLKNTDNVNREQSPIQLNYPVIEDPQSLIERWTHEGRRMFPTSTSTILGMQGYFNSGITSNYITKWCGTTYNEEYYTKKIDPKPLFRYMKKMFPFVVDIPRITHTKQAVYYNPNTFNPVHGKLFEITVTLHPTHFSETYVDDDVRKKLAETMRTRLSQLIKCMYEEITDGCITFVFEPAKSETLLEDMKKLNYI